MSPVSMTRHGAITVVTVNNPPVNALSQAVREGLVNCIVEAENDHECRAIVIACAGRTFIAGADIDQIADEQGVRYILDGSVRKSGNKVRVNVQLIDSETGENSWVEQYDRDLDDIFAVQDDITRNITIAMRSQLIWGAGATTDWARGTSSVKAWETCTVAAELQDSYIRADNLEAQRLAEKALELDPLSSIIRSDYGEVATVAGEFELAERILTDAYELDPQFVPGLSSLAYLEWEQGRIDEGLRWTLRGMKLDPDSMLLYISAHHSLSDLGLFEQAEVFAMKARELQPEHRFPIFMDIFRNALQGRQQPAQPGPVLAGPGRHGALAQPVEGEARLRVVAVQATRRRRPPPTRRPPKRSRNRRRSRSRPRPRTSRSPSIRTLS